MFTDGFPGITRRGLLPAWAAFFVAVAFVPGDLSAKVLRDKSTGLKVKAPTGFRLKANGGVYTVTNGRQYVKFVLANSGASVSDTADAFIKLSKIKGAKKKKNGRAYTVTGKLKGKSVQVEFAPKGSNVSIATFGGLTATKGASLRMPKAGVTVADILTLKRIVASRRGGSILPLAVAIPMRQFVGGDGTSAFIPDRPGWTASANGGVFVATNANEGIVELGVPQYVNVPPQNAYGAPISNIVPAGQAIVNVWPQYAAMFGASVQLLAVQEVPGTNGWLAGPYTYSSGMYAIRFNLLGRTWSGLMVSGTFSVQLDNVAWSWYHSYVAVPDNGIPGMGAALLNTWATWDNSAASQARLNQALATVLSTRVSGFPIDPEVFQNAADNWSAYIRE